MRRIGGEVLFGRSLGALLGSRLVALSRARHRQTFHPNNDRKMGGGRQGLGGCGRFKFFGFRGGSTSIRERESTRQNPHPSQYEECGTRKGKAHNSEGLATRRSGCYDGNGKGEPVAGLARPCKPCKVSRAGTLCDQGQFRSLGRTSGV